jgi:hypothetical protein
VYCHAPSFRMNYSSHLVRRFCDTNSTDLKGCEWLLPLYECRMVPNCVVYLCRSVCAKFIGIFLAFFLIRVSVLQQVELSVLRSRKQKSSILLNKLQKSLVNTNGISCLSAANITSAYYSRGAKWMRLYHDGNKVGVVCTLHILTLY